MKFFVGEIVRLKNGYAPQRILEISYKSCVIKANGVFTGCCIKAQYLSTINTSPSTYRETAYWRPYTDFQKMDEPDYQQHKEEVEEMSQSLFQTKGENPRFGTQIAVNSKGELVLEMKETGKVEVFSPEDVEEVVPHTVRVRFIYLNGQKNEADVFVPDGLLKKGDLLIDVSASQVVFVSVLETNTKKKNAANLSGKLKKIAAEDFNVQ